MALWPFRRRSARKRPRSGAALSDAEGPPPRSMTEGAVPRSNSIKKQRTEPAKLQRRARTHSFSPDRQEVLQVDRTARTQQQYGSYNDASQLPWDRTPTLHHSTGKGRKPSRRKSSKRRRKDPNREAEIKAMSKYMPVRPATDSVTAGRPMRKDSQQVKTNAVSRHWDHHPSSDISLPMPSSIHSSMSSESEMGAFRVSTFDSLAPRPTLRYATGSRWPSSTKSAGVHRTSSQKKTFAEKGTILEEAANRRIDDLADELDARELRELMERDNRRRSKQRQRDQKKAAERLSRREQKQTAAHAAAAKSGTPPPENLERGVLGRELVGLGIDPTSAVVTSSKIRTSASSELLGNYSLTSDADSSKQKPLDTFHGPATEIIDDSAAAAVPTEKHEVVQTLDAPKDTHNDAIIKNHQQDVQQSETEEKVSSLPSGSVFAGLMRRNKSRSKSTLGSERDKTATPPYGKYDDEDMGRKGSEASNTKPGRFSLTSLLRRGGKNRRNSSGHPSFSNTSREEMQAAGYSVAYAQAQAQQQPNHQRSQEQMQAQNKTQSQSIAQAHALAKLEGKESPSSQGGRYVKGNNAIPKRTRSRFKEDLPDFPISPPASRVQSPEAEPPLPSVIEQKYETGTRPIAIPGARAGSSISAQRSTEAMRLTPTSPDPHQSMSLASIDSEGSWLSGGRLTARRSLLRDSIAHSSRQEPAHPNDSPTNSTQEDLGIMEDEYLSRLTPVGNRVSLVKSLSHRSDEGRPSSDEDDLLEESDLRWGKVAGAHPHMVNRETMRSRQGMLNIVSGDEDEVEESSSDNSAEAPSSRATEKASIGRARSVDLHTRVHARNFSAGSAKLLDIHPARGSMDVKPETRFSASEPLL